MAAPEGAARLLRFGRHAGRAMVDLLLPPGCPCCDAPVGAPGLLCADCFQTLTLLAEPLCRRCGVPFPFQAAGGRAGLCPGCREHPPLFDRARAAFRYDAGAQRLILPLKYADRTELAEVLALHMVRAGAELLRVAEVLVPVPLHRRRLFARRYNQAALLARALARRSGLPVVPDALIRRRATSSLGELAAAERVAELAGAFAVRASRARAIRGRRVVLIDDVLTSGATANACTEALREAGAGAIDVLAAARVPDPRMT
ncbi:MAG: ComF family protein [Rhodospirillales bacterium]|nr:ComF family protein [Rhodospirillales bacterium]